MTNSRGPNTHEEFHKVRAADREEGRRSLAGNRPGEESLPGSRWAHQQDSLGHGRTKAPEPLRVLQEFDHFLQFLFYSSQPGHILEGYFSLLSIKHLRAALQHGGNTFALASRHPTHPLEYQ